jgi:hypothetical protein
MKLFTIDNRLIQKSTGHLSASDRERVRENLRKTMAI